MGVLKDYESVLREYEARMQSHSITTKNSHTGGLFPHSKVEKNPVFSNENPPDHKNPKP